MCFELFSINKQMLLKLINSNENTLKKVLRILA
jgi:hypothetical protein